MEVAQASVDDEACKYFVEILNVRVYGPCELVAALLTCLPFLFFFSPLLFSHPLLVRLHFIAKGWEASQVQDRIPGLLLHRHRGAARSFAWIFFCLYSWHIFALFLFHRQHLTGFFFLSYAFLIIFLSLFSYNQLSILYITHISSHVFYSSVFFFSFPFLLSSTIY